MILEIIILVILVAISATIIYYRKNLKKNWKKILVVVTSGMILGGGYMLLDDIPVADSGWWVDTNWGYTKKIIINSSLVDDTLTNFPILVHITGDTDLGSHAQDDGDDLLFTMNGDNETKLNHEIEYYDNASGTVAADIWINITTLSSDTDTVIWMYYGNNTCDSQENASGVWNNHDMTARYSMSDDIVDSINSNNGIKADVDNPLESDGNIYEYQEFDGIDDYITIHNSTATTFDGAYTISLWVKPEGATGSSSYPRIVQRPDNDGHGYSFRLNNNMFIFQAKQYSETVNAQFYENYEIGEWYHLTGIYNGSDVKLYVDGVLAETTLNDGAGDDGVLNDVIIGRRANISTAVYYYEGGVDELRFYDSELNASEIKTHYNNIVNAVDGGFYDIIDTIEFSNEYPEDNEVGITLPVTCSITLSESTGQDMNVTFASNYTGSWVNYQTNSSVGDGTYRWLFDIEGESSTLYYWKVYANNSIQNISRTYSFTSEASQSVTGFYKLITLNSSQIPSSLIDFPVLINITDTDLRDYARSDGYDISFTNYDNTTTFNYEREHFDSETGKLIAWVNVTSLSGVSDTKIWMHYGDSEAEDQQNRDETWDSGFRAVYHFAETSGAATDSAGRVRYFNATTTNPNDQEETSLDSLGNCYRFDDGAGETYYIDIPLGVFTDENMDGTGNDGLTEFTIEFWQNPDKTSANSWGFLEDSSHWELSSNGAGWRFRPELDAGGEGTFNVNCAQTQDTWQLFTLKWNTTSDVLTAYKDATITQSAGTTNAAHIQDSGSGTYAPDTNRIGWADDTDTYGGHLDEIRVHGVTRSDDWIRTSYNSMINATDGGFFTMGEQQEELTFSNFEKIVINCSYIDEPLTNFPVFIKILSHENLSSYAMSNGNDITFWSLDNNTQFNHEIENYDSATGKLFAWVNVTSLASDTDTEFWMKYGYPGLSNQENVSGVWTTYAGVWHLSETSAVDSTGNGNTGTPTGSPSVVSGLINDAVDFGTTSNEYWIDLGTDNSIDLSGLDTCTIESWVMFDSDTVNGNGQEFFIQSQGDDSWNIGMGTHNNVDSSNTVKFLNRDEDTTVSHDIVDSDQAIDTGNWHYWVGTYNNGTSDNKSLYYDGEWLNGTTDSITTLRSGPATATSIGAVSSGASHYPLDGKIDEFRISKDVKNASWIKATYHSVNDSDFLTVTGEGLEENYAPVIVPNPSDGYLFLGENVTLEATISDANNDLMSGYFKTNVSGTWETLGTFSSYDNTVYQPQRSIWEEGIHYWTVNATDGTEWTNETYSFTVCEPYGVDEFTNYLKITIDHDLVDENLVNFPLLVRINETISDDCNYGRSLRFYSSDNVTLFPYEIEGSWNMSGENIIWINVSSVSASEDTIIWMNYDNPAVYSLHDPSSVWDSNYLGVWHMFDENVTDSTSNNFDAKSVIGNPYGENGLIGRSVRFDGDGMINLTDVSNVTTSLTVECWVNIDQTPSNSYGALVTKGTWSDPVDEDGNYELWAYHAGDNGKTLLQIEDLPADYDDDLYGADIRGNGWTYVAGTWSDTTDDLILYNNESTQSYDGVATGPISGTSGNLTFGNREGMSENWFLDGSVDEIRISKIARNSSWVNATYRNQNEDSIFLTVGEPVFLYSGTLNDGVNDGEYYFAYGDSVTRAKSPGGDLNPDGWSCYIMQLVNDSDPTRTADHNMDGGGRDSLWAIDNFGSHYNENNSYFFIWFGFNDIDHDPPITPAETGQNIVELYNMTKENGSIPIILVNHLRVGPGGADDNGSETNDIYQRERINATMLECENYSIPYLKEFDALDTIPWNGRLDSVNDTNYIDHVHLNHTGHKLVAEFVWYFIQGLDKNITYNVGSDNYTIDVDYNETIYVNVSERGWVGYKVTCVNNDTVISHRVVDDYVHFNGIKGNTYNLTQESETTYESSVRCDGIDYFVWLGDNCTLSDVGENISGFDEAGEYVSILGDDGAWDVYYGDTSGVDSDVYTFDVIRVVLDDTGDDVTITMTENPDYTDAYENRTFTLTYVVTQGVNYTGFSNGDGSTLGAEADKTGFLDVGEVISVWDDTNYKWIAHLQGTTINQNTAIDKWDVCYTRIYDTETWNQSGA